MSADNENSGGVVKIRNLSGLSPLGIKAISSGVGQEEGMKRCRRLKHKHGKSGGKGEFLAILGGKGV